MSKVPGPCWRRAVSSTEPSADPPNRLKVVLGGFADRLRFVALLVGPHQLGEVAGRVVCHRAGTRGAEQGARRRWEVVHVLGNREWLTDRLCPVQIHALPQQDAVTSEDDGVGTRTWRLRSR